jgi:glucuronosyltransferase
LTFLSFHLNQKRFYSNLFLIFRYDSNVKRLQSLLRDQPETPLERAVFWTEYVLRNKGAAALQLGSRNLSRFQRNLIDVYCILFATFVSLTVAVALVIRWACSRRPRK